MIIHDGLILSNTVYLYNSLSGSLEGEGLAFQTHADRAARRKITGQNPLREGILDPFLDHPLQRPGAVHRIVALAGDQVAGRIGQDQFDVLLGKAVGQVLHLNIDNPADLARLEVQENNGLVDAVEELGLEAGPQGLQRALGVDGGVVLEGRDIGTVVFPDAEFKIYLDASIDVRARRRHAELAAKGTDVDLDVLAAEIAERDRANTERALAPLRKAEDARVIDTSGMTLDGQVDDKGVVKLEALGGFIGRVR